MAVMESQNNSMPQPQTPFSTGLPQNLYRAATVRELNRTAIEEHGISGLTLMRRAGKAAFIALQSRWPDLPLTIICGTGNNGGDGYVMASLAKQQGVSARIVQCGDVEKIRGDALQARKLALQDGIEVVAWSDDFSMPEQGIIIDALLGTGLTGDIRGEAAAAIAAINASPCSVVAVDIPSGLCSDTGRVLGGAVRADLIVCFIGLKQGLLTGQGPDCAGEILFDDLAVPAEVFDALKPDSQRLDLPALLAQFPKRKPSDHKGRFGHVLVIGGDHGMGGAAIMAAQAAAVTGAGLISCATRAEHIAPLLARQPEVMAVAVDNGQQLAPLLAKASVLVIGPGLGQAAWGQQLLVSAAKTGLPMVVDADALNLLVKSPLLADYPRDNWLLTPHPGEASRLLACACAEVKADRFAAVAALQKRYGGAVVLKGVGTLVADSDSIGLCPYGNPGMGSGGMGDVLSGVLGALLAQGLAPIDAARLGVCLHAYAGDMAAADGQRGLLATDLLQPLRQLLG